MSKFFHFSLKQGRSDTLVLEADTYQDIQSFCSGVSTASLINIKEIIYSKEYGINFRNKPFVPVGHYRRVNVMVSSQDYSHIFELYHVKKNITREKIERVFLENVLIKGQRIKRVESVVVFE